MKSSARRRSSPVSRSSASLAAFLITLVVGPVSAGVDDFTIPPEPLSVGAPVPPNLLLLLDDSGSMAWTYLYEKWTPRVETALDVSKKRVQLQNGYGNTGSAVMSTLNALAYDPRVTYRPWQNPDGSDMPDMDPAATATHPALLAGQFGIGVDSLYNPWYMHWFYVAKPGTPKPTLAVPGDLSDYTLYKLIDANTAQVCTTAEKDAQGRWKNPGWLPWPQGSCQPITRFQWTTDSGGVITRSLAEEWRNYANWYGYHRTRMKVTKAAITRTFSRLDENMRLGYAVLTDTSRNFDIPVQTADGLFKGANRTAWFERVYNEVGQYDTPLRQALNRTGEYFMRRDERGPWGPEPPDRQLACRQNFVILATDGEWNDNSVAVGNEDGQQGPLHRSPTGATYQYKPAPPYRDAQSQTLADVAMKYWKRDLRDDLPNTVPTTQADPAFWQHMVTFTISIGMEGTLDPVADWPALVAGTKSWPDPFFNGTTDDLFHASVNGHGSYVSAMNPEALNQGLEAALSAISERTASGSSLAFDSTTLEAGKRSFMASYLPGAWSGDLKAYAITSTGVSGTQVWSAADGIPAHDKRLLYTHVSPGRSGKWPTQTFPTDEQRTALTADVAAWIRGDRSLEGTTLRTRKSLLGDIVHSSPVHVRTAGVEAVFVGANDGMLHVFDATNGKELLAYVPGLLDMTRLKELSRAKPFRHRYFVDGPLTVARTDGANGVLAVGTLGRGGRGVYGLSVDLARPKQPPSSWEFNDSMGMGQVLSQPQLVRVQAGRSVPDTVLVANGINSPDGKAVLYVLDAATGTLRNRIVAGNETGNGLSTPTVLDLDGDGLVDTAYAGDLRGNVWRFNLKGAGSVTRVFTATDANGNRQPITGGIGVAFHPGDAGQSNARPWIFFGTGRYLTAADGADRSIQSWYGMADSGAAATRSQLLARKITGSGTVGGKPVRLFEKARANDMLGKRGWVIDLRVAGAESEGERMISESQQIIGGRTLLAASMAPTDGGCGGNGRGYLNAIDLFTGGATPTPFFDANGDGKFDGQDTLQNTAVGSIDLGLGMISDPGILLGKPGGGEDHQKPGAGEDDEVLSQACAGGTSGTSSCLSVNLDEGRYRGRVSWLERIQQ